MAGRWRLCSSLVWWAAPTSSPLLGRDSLGEQALEQLQALGLRVSVVWRDQPTRRAITYIDADGERSITVVGQRLSPFWR